MKKFEFWDNNSGEMVYIMEEDAIAAHEVAHSVFGPNVELLNVYDAAPDDMEVQK